jgi:hypothetical protein
LPCSLQSFRKLRSFHSHRKTFFIPSKSAAFHSFIHSAGYIRSLFQVGALALPAKNSTARQKSRQPCVFHVSSRSPHSATLHCGPFAAATLAPLADGSRLSTPQAKKLLRYRYANFLPAPFRLKAVLPALFLTMPTPAPDHPPLKQLKTDFICVPRRFLKLPNIQIAKMEIWKFKAVIFCPKKRICKVSNSAYRQ